MNLFPRWSVATWLLALSLPAIAAPEAPARDWQHDLLENDGLRPRSKLLCRVEPNPI